jgi:RNA 3'-terminal phosphate cyclase (ATP)
LTFSPHQVRPGNYHFKIGTAGATTLVLQTLYLPLCRCGETSKVTLLGGTHVSWSPSYHYLEWQWLAYLDRCGFNARLSLDQAGFYPRGGGQIQAIIHPSPVILPLISVDRGRLVRIRGLSAVANLSEEIGRRQKLQALRRLEPVCRDTKIELTALPSPDKGTAIILLAEFEHSQACFSALGELNKRAETVADEAVDDLLAFMEKPGAIDEHLADQLLLPLCLATEPSTFTTNAVTQHLLTNAVVIQYFLPARIIITGVIDQPGQVIITPRSSFYSPQEPVE